MLTLILAIAITSPKPHTIHFDRIDVNHVVGKDGKVRFDQLIFWRWSRVEKRFISFGYAMIRDGRVNGQWTGSKLEPRWDGRRYVVELTKGKQRWLVTANTSDRVWTLTDHEMRDRCEYPKHDREWR